VEIVFMAISLQNPTPNQLIENQIDVTGAKHVQIQTRFDGKVIWINVDGICLLRICQIENLEVDKGI